MRTEPNGAYGFRFLGLDDAAPWMVDAPDSWPTVSVSQVVASSRPKPRIDDDLAEVPLLGGGHLKITRRPLALTFVSRARPLSTAELIHPFLAPAASVLAKWHGYVPLHAGAVVVDGRAWVITGEREAGKSATLGELARRGHGVLADDLVVLKGGAALAGPRSLDLRAVDDEGAAEDLGVVGQRRRWRLALSEVDCEVPVGGLIQLTWGSARAVRVPSKATRNQVSFAAASMPLDPRQMLTLLAIPTFALVRPRSGVAETADLLTNMIGSLPSETDSPPDGSGGE